MERFTNDDSTLKETSQCSREESLNNCSRAITAEPDSDDESQFSQEPESHSQNTASSTSQQDAMECSSNTTPLGKYISKEAIAIAHCLVDTSLKQLCLFFCQARSARGPMSGPRFFKKASTTWYVTASLSGTFHPGK